VTARMWVAVGAMSALLVLCFCMACLAFCGRLSDARLLLRHTYGQGLDADTP